MKKVYESMNFTEVGLLKTILMKNEIECFIKHEGVFLAAGTKTPADVHPELWIQNDEDEARALQLVAGWIQKRTNE